MKNHHCLYTLLFTILAQPVVAADLSITIENIHSHKGNIYLALFTKDDRFPDVSHQTKGITLPIEHATVTSSFTNLADNEYAVAVFHDENNNQKLDKNFFGIPKEPYGFSNTQLAPPSFDEAKFSLSTHDIHLLIKLR
ncbi:hypothetical protein A9Q92_03480 [Methylophaga sp. 42_8_T64]|nr:hypothetical protein A9Q92_03480 [Methylophaga sp. 42_8_T64]